MDEEKEIKIYYETFLLPLWLSLERKCMRRGFFFPFFLNPNDGRVGAHHWGKKLFSFLTNTVYVIETTWHLINSTRQGDKKVEHRKVE